MKTGETIHLYEKVFLLALKDKEGTVFVTVNYRHALAGAIIAELLLRNIVAIENSRWGKYLIIKNSSITGDEILDECIARISKAKRRAQLKGWVQRIANMPKMKTRVAQQLCRKKILKEREEKVLFIFKHRIYPEVDPRPEKNILDKLEKAIFGSSTSIEPETVILISICDKVGLLNKIFDRKRLKERKNRIKQLIKGEVIGTATKEAIEAMQAAVMVATVVPAVASAGH